MRIAALVTVSSLVLSAGAVSRAADETNNPAPETMKTPPRTLVLLHTSRGDIKAEIFTEQAPVSAANFLQYVDDKFYDGTIFHRVIDGFMIQGGGFTKDLQQKPTRGPIKNEAGNGLKNDRGTLAMARRGDPDSATSQFFINVVNNDSLNCPRPDGYGYAVFGKVVEGMDIVDQIKAVPTGVRNGMGDVPVEPVEVIEIRRIP